MTRTIEHIATTHQIAQERRAAGKPIWHKTIDIKDILDRSAGDTSNKHCVLVATEIANRLRSHAPSEWVNIQSEHFDWELNDLLESLELMTEEDEPEGKLVDELNAVLGGLYDWADIQRIWLG